MMVKSETSMLTELPPFVHRKVAKGLTYYYFAVEGRNETKPIKLVRLPDISDPKFNARVLELARRRPATTAPRRRLRKLEKLRVYFIGGDEGPIKIGRSCDPEARCREMNVGAPIDYRVLATTQGGSAMERAYHLRFEYARLRGEWFERRPEIEAEIQRLRTKQEAENGVETRPISGRNPPTQLNVKV
jgi:hypothetical protein